MNEQISIVEEFYKALGEGDRSGAFELLSEDFEMVQAPSLPYGGSYKGKSALADYFKKFGKSWKSTRSEDVHYYSDKDKVIAHHRFIGERSDGKKVEMPIVQIYTIIEGKISKAEPFYQDTHQIIS